MCLYVGIFCIVASSNKGFRDHPYSLNTLTVNTDFIFCILNNYFYNKYSRNQNSICSKHIKMLEEFTCNMFKEYYYLASKNVLNYSHDY